MKLNPIGSNRNEVELGNARVLFSYRTPVAAYIDGQGWFRTEQKWSVTTSRHINQWIGAGAQERPQAFFDSLAAKV